MASLPYPRHPPNSFHRTHSKFVCASPPTDFTDAHRSFACTGSSHGIHGIHRNFRRRIFSHRLHRIHRSFWRRIASHRCAQMVRLRRVLPRNSQNTQKLLAENILPQISQIFTDFSSPLVVSVCSANSVGK